MSITLPAVGALPSIGTTTAAPARPEAARSEGPGFAERMGEAMDGLVTAQAEAREAATAFELGLENDLAGVMVRQQVASLGFDLALNVRNKALGAYRDIMNMPV